MCYQQVCDYLCGETLAAYRRIGRLPASSGGGRVSLGWPSRMWVRSVDQGWRPASSKLLLVRCGGPATVTSTCSTPCGARKRTVRIALALAQHLAPDSQRFRLNKHSHAAVRARVPTQAVSEVAGSSRSQRGADVL